MKSSISLTSLCLLLFFILSCKKQQVEQTRYLTFYANPSYIGTHPTVGLISNIYIQDKKEYMQFFMDIENGDVAKIYKLRIHSADTTQTYGYNVNPLIDLGDMSDNKPVSTKVNYLSFTDFTQSFKGYYIIQDPDNISIDTTTLLFFGKIGNWE